MAGVAAVIVSWRAVVLALCGLVALVGMLGFFGCAVAPTIAPEGEVVAPPQQYEEMCRERPIPNLCPEV